MSIGRCGMNVFQGFWGKVFNTVNPFFVSLSAAVTFLLFPEKAFEMWSIAIWTATALDLLTKNFAIFFNSIRKEKSIQKGIYMAIKTRTFSSDIFYHKTVVKVVSYLVIQILVGLSMRLSLIGTVNIVVATVIYNFVFWREFASNIENLIEAGADYLYPLLFWVKKKERESMDDKEDKS
jgi:hypothetical protein